MKKTKKTISISILILLIILALTRFYISEWHTQSDFDTYCKSANSEAYEYVWTVFYGHSCGRESDKTTTLKLFPFTLEELDIYCEKPKLWEMHKWSLNCENN